MSILEIPNSTLILISVIGIVWFSLLYWEKSRNV